MQNFIKNLIKKNQNKNKKGFTLFELILAIAIIATLSVVVIVAFNAFRDLAKSNNASRFSGINTIQKALDQYYINNGSYPAGILPGTYLEICDTGQETLENGTTNCAGKVDLRLLVPDYIGALPRDPNGGGYKVGLNPTINKISLWADKAQLGALVAINPMGITLEINGFNVVGNTLNAILGSLGLNLNPEDIIWYTVSGGIETEVGRGLSYTVKPGDAGSEIVAKVVLSKETLASDNAGNAILLASGDKNVVFDVSPALGFDNIVRTISNQTDGKVIVGGDFTTYQGVVAARVIRLNSDGTRDNNFNIGIGFNSNVLGSAIQTDGKVILGGQFTTYQGVSTNRIIRLDSDGTRDSSFNIGTGFNNSIRVLSIQGDGKVIVGGDFTTYQGVGANRIIRLNSNGSIDSSFNIGTGFNNTVNTVIVQSDDKVIVGGTFTTYQGVGANRIIRLNINGSIDSGFIIGTGFNSNVLSLAIQTDGKIIVGGDITTYQGVGANRIIRLNSNGSRDNSFDMGTGFNSSVNSIVVQGDGKFVIGGAFTTYQVVGVNRIMRLNINGSTDTSLNTGTGLNGNVRTIVNQNDGKVIIGGEFMTYQGVSSSRIVRLNSNGTRDASFNVGTGFNNNVLGMALQSDGKIIVVGDFTSYQGVAANRIIRLNSDGTRDSSLNMLAGFNATVNTVAIQGDGKLIVGGGYTAYQGGAANRIIRLNSNGSIDSSFNIGTGFNGTVNNIVLQSNGNIIAGGSFTTYQGVGVNRIIRLNSNGSIDSSFNIGTGFSSTVRVSLIQTDGKVIVGGDFATYQGVSASRIIRLNSNGSIDSSFNVGTGFSNIVYGLGIQGDGKVIIVGSFTGYQGVAANRVIRLNSNGTRDSSFNIGTGLDNQAFTMSLYNNKVMVGGAFTLYKNLSAGYFLELVP